MLKRRRAMNDDADAEDAFAAHFLGALALIFCLSLGAALLIARL